MHIHALCVASFSYAVASSFTRYGFTLLAQKPFQLLSLSEGTLLCKYLDRFTVTGAKMVDVKPQIEDLEQRAAAANRQGVSSNREVLRQAKMLYDQCYKAYMIATGDMICAEIMFKVSMAAAIPTIGVSLLVAIGPVLYKRWKRHKLKLLTLRCSAIGVAVAEYADIGFTRTSEGHITVVGSLPFGNVEEVARFLNGAI